MTILQQILDKKAEQLPDLKATSPSFPALNKKRPSLYTSLMTSPTLQVISEMKRASPSKGDIRTDVDPIVQTKHYEKAGACCISVLTETHYFKGSYNDLHAVAKNVAIPVLCKDFIIDEVQIDYAKAAGASVILLIVAALTKEQLQRLYDYAYAAELEALVEVHDVEELEIALSIGANIIGVNNRNLKTFEVDLQTTKTIADALDAKDVAFISESGIFTADDAQRVANYGARAVLVGESLMRSDDVQAALRALQVPLTQGAEQ